MISIKVSELCYKDLEEIFNNLPEKDITKIKHVNKIKKEFIEENDILSFDSNGKK